MTTDETIDLLVGSDRPDWVERSHFNYVGIAAHLVRKRGRAADADALELLQQGRRSYFLGRCCVPMLFLILNVGLAVTPEWTMTWSLWRCFMVGAFALWLAAGLWQFRRADSRLRDLNYEGTALGKGSPS